MLLSKKWLRNHPQFLLHFLIHIDVLMLCRKFELIPSSNFRVMTILKNWPIFENFPVLCPMLFSKKWLRNHPQFLLDQCKTLRGSAPRMFDSRHFISL